ncbi:MAG: nucleoside 2-deoxyribosyltransferase [Candidatus Andersenbacteria bacterium]
MNGVHEPQTRVYLAGPLFGMADQRFNCDLKKALQTIHSYTVHLPQSLGAPQDPDLVWQTCRSEIERSDVLVANFDGPIADDGTALEAEAALNLGKPVILFRTDVRGHESEGFNLMFRDPRFRKVTVRPDVLIEYLAEKLHTAIQEELHKSFSREQA